MTSSPSNAPPHVLVLDDDEGILRLERRTLERAGYRVSGTVRLEEAAATVDADPPNLLLIDYNLGVGHSGLDFYRSIQERGHDIPAILVTGFSDEGRAIEALRAGVRDVIPKVGDYLDFLPEAVKRVLEQVRSARALAEAEAASRAKDRFLAILSHELRTPLTPALTAVQLLQSTPNLPPDVRESVALIRRSIELEVCLIDDLLDVTRIARGKLHLQTTITDLHARLANALETVADEARSKGLIIRLQLEASRTTVQADPTRLQQVFWNLLKNAIKFTPSGGSIRIHSSDDPQSDRVQVAVTDTGIGIAHEALPRIFQPFDQANEDVTKRFGGLGLGLNICKVLVEAHGGQIQATSPGIGKGATFRVELPAAVPSAVATTGSLAANAPPVGLQALTSSDYSPRLLLVDDHADSARALARALRKLGHHVTTADSVASALQIAGVERFDLVVSDIGLPDGSGLDLMRQLRTRYRLDGIAVSGFGTEEDLARSREAGFREHLVKPISLDSLLAAMQRVRD